MKKILFFVIKRLPSNYLRVEFYKLFFKYKIGSNVKIGKCVINANHVIIGDNVLIRDKNHISCNTLKIDNNVSIHSGNMIMGTANFSIGENSRIINNHFIDLYNNVTIGSNSWLAGKNSQIWTHGSISTKIGKNLEVTIGNDVYVGSNVSIAPGVKISNKNLIGLGSVVNKSFLDEKTIIIGNPSKIVKTDIDWRKDW
jgi:acetyltransferase-like isoleucine patch superfamily enzyme